MHVRAQLKRPAATAALLSLLSGLTLATPSVGDVIGAAPALVEDAVVELSREQVEAQGNIIRLPRPGSAVFWDGPLFESTGGLPILEDATLVGANAFYRGTVADQHCEMGWLRCFDYLVRLEQTGARLRVAADLTYARAEFDLYVVGPDGRHHFPPRLAWSHEVFIADPPPGDYRVRVTQYFSPPDAPQPQDQVKMRAKLERAPHGVTPAHKQFLPDIEPIPPWGLSNPGPNCAISETQDGAKECLRFFFGWANIGEGPFDLRLIMPPKPRSDGQLGGPIEQRVLRGDGTMATVGPAGHYVFHPHHGHIHQEEAFELRLFRVVDPVSGIYVPAGNAAKRGACAHDGRIHEFDRFYQAPAGSQDSGDDCDGPFRTEFLTDSRIGLSVGWADVYWPSLPDNYIEWSDRPSGLYLLQMMFDAPNLVLESDERNNVGYTYFEFARGRGDPIRQLERGLGTDPWDKQKRVLLPYY